MVMKVSSGLAAARFVEIRPSVQPDRLVFIYLRGTAGVALELRCRGGSRATIFGAQPNKRLKLAAPSCCGSLLFVNTSRSRRSLGAPR